ncbi:MAG: DMT family transporter [Candidatus Methanoperedens sp.]|nr:DMT family transporter [Candidatus Methanoperedens sp.]
MKTDRFSGYGEIIIAAILWSLAGIFAKQITGMSAQSIIFYRVSFAFIIFFFALVMTGKLNILKLREKRSYLFLFSILQMATMVAYFISIMNASVSIAVLLLSTAPIYITIFSPWLLKEKIRTKGIIALVLSLAGILLIVDPGKLDFKPFSIGILAGIASGIFYAFEVMTSKYVSSTYSGYTQAFWSFLIATIILIPVGIVPLEVVSSNLIYLLILAIFPTILAVSLYFNGLKKVKTQSASILGLIEPISAVFFAVIILGENISNLEITGGALILIGAALVTTDR